MKATRACPKFDPGMVGRPPRNKNERRLSQLAAQFLLTSALMTAFSGRPAEAGFVLGTSANLVATDNFFPSVFIDGTAIVGATNQFSGFQDLGIMLSWTARVDANSLTISLVTSRGIATFGTPRYSFAFTDLTLEAGTDLSDLELISESNLDALVSSAGANSIDIGIKSADTRLGPLAAFATFALPAASVPEPGSGIIFGTMVALFGLFNHLCRSPVTRTRAGGSLNPTLALWRLR